MAHLPKQLQLGYRTHGGSRPGAGRKPAGPRAGEPHVARAVVVGRVPLHVTMRVVRLLPSLRSERAMRVLRAAFAQGRKRPGFRLVQYAVQPDHLHLTVVKGYLRKLITNDRVARYLEQYQPELFIEFQKIAEMTSTLPSEAA